MSLNASAAISVTSEAITKSPVHVVPAEATPPVTVYVPAPHMTCREDAPVAGKESNEAISAHTMARFFVRRRVNVLIFFTLQGFRPGGWLSTNT